MILILPAIVTVITAALQHRVLLDPRIVLQIPSGPLDCHAVFFHVVEQLLLVDGPFDGGLGVDGFAVEGAFFVRVDVAELLTFDAFDITNLMKRRMN